MLTYNKKAVCLFKIFYHVSLYLLSWLICFVSRFRNVTVFVVHCGIFLGRERSLPKNSLISAHSELASWLRRTQCLIQCVMTVLDSSSITSNSRDKQKNSKCKFTIHCVFYCIWRKWTFQSFFCKKYSVCAFGDKISLVSLVLPLFSLHGRLYNEIWYNEKYP